MGGVRAAVVDAIVMRRRLALPVVQALAVLAIASTPLGCSSTRSVSIPGEGQTSPGLAALPKSVAITAYTTRDGARHSLEAMVERQDDGSWRFRPRDHGRKSFTMGPGELEALEVTESTGVGKAGVALLLVGLAAFATWVLMWSATDWDNS